MPHNRDDLRTGLFLLFGTGLALTAVLLVADLGSYFEQSQTARVYFPLAGGLQGLKEGAAVTLGDQPVGKVESIGDVTQADRVVGKLVEFRLPSRYKLAWDAQVELVPELIGGGTKLNFRSVGAGRPYSLAEQAPAQLHTLTPPPPTGALVAAPPASTLTRSLGIDEPQRRQIADIIAHVERLTRALADARSQEPVPVERIITDLSAAVADIRQTTKSLPTLARRSEDAVKKIESASVDIAAITAELRERTPDWTAQVDRVGASLEDAASRASVVGKDAEAITASTKRLIDEKSPVVSRTLDHLELAAQSLRERTLKQVDDAITAAGAAMENLKQGTADVRSLVAGQRPVLERALANAQLTSDQLKLAAIEVRRSPWRLLYTPSEEELETDNLYDAARTFALAAGALDSASQSLRAVQSAGPQDAQRLTPMLDQLEKLFAKFEEAEGRFWEALKSRPRP